MWWLAHGEQDVPASLEWLSPHERDHLATIHYTKRRDEYLTRRFTAKQALATVLDLGHDPSSLSRIEVRHHQSGAPYVVHDGVVVEVEVSLSDRAGWAVCLVGQPGVVGAGRLGIDLEIVEPRTDGFVDDFLTAAERDHVRSFPDADRRDEAANLIWSAKEAALKVQQVGLRADTRSVEVQLAGERRADGWVPMTVVGHDGPMPGWWRRDGVFLLTIVRDVPCDLPGPCEPPVLLPTGSALADARPRHSWLTDPTC